MNDAITQEITITATIETVWDVVTKPEHMSKWFADKAAFELQAGVKGNVSWSELGEVPIEIVTVDQPHTFALSWIAPDEETHGTEKTLITFDLSEIDGGTLVRITESGFSQIALTETEKTTLVGKHASGWPYFLGKLRDYAEDLISKA